MQVVAAADARYGAPNLRLDGGTALAAFHLGHRVSKDLDFFADYQVNAAAFAEVVREVAEERGFEMRPTRARSMGFAQFIARDPEAGIEVQLDFAAASPFHLEERDVAAEGIQVSSYRDLCAGKLHAICDRYEPRDYVDLHAILTRPDHDANQADEPVIRDRFRGMVADLMQTDPGLDALLVGNAVERGRARPIVARLPYTLFIDIDDDAMQRTIGICADEAANIAAAQKFG
ncbi:nucleotidyl transferase AbiEii/AbiGii toxin family protein [Longimicrobium sp.]|uniref:nucleotidyl transferase AbiEii/AbiGii toxin family protein n=1 Tax=Longimicrobium sp. TaxID=2029185 RepID=UPI003B39FFFE